jgi:hypothetical protein
MNKVRFDLTGMVFGNWTVIKRSDKYVHSDIFWVCECKCGYKSDVRSTSLRRGFSRSCGCMKFKQKSRKERIWGASDEAE